MTNRKRDEIDAEIAKLNEPVAEDNRRERRLEQLERKKEILDALEFDVYEEGTILTFTKMFGGDMPSSGTVLKNVVLRYGVEPSVVEAKAPRGYTYAFLKANGWWYGTGENMRKAAWPDLVAFITDGELVDGLWIVTALDELA